MQPHHPFLVDYWAVDVDGDLEWHLIGHGDLDLFLNDLLDWVVHVDWFVDVDWFV